MSEAESDREVRAVVIAGAGDNAFRSGADLKAIGRGYSIIPEGREAQGLAGFVGHAISKPAVAGQAVNRYCAGSLTTIGNAAASIKSGMGHGMLGRRVSPAAR